MEGLLTTNINILFSTVPVAIAAEVEPVVLGFNFEAHNEVCLITSDHFRLT